MKPGKYSLPDYIIPWVEYRCFQEIIRRQNRLPTPEPFAPRHSITYFNNYKKHAKILAGTQLVYDRMHKIADYDQRKSRCDRATADDRRAAIHEENKNNFVSIVASFEYGRPNRPKIDFLNGKYRRTKMIEQSFYRRNDLNLETTHRVLREEAKTCNI